MEISDKRKADFLALVSREEGQGPHGDCWEFQLKQRKDGYTDFGLTDASRGLRKKFLSHRLAYFIETGIDPGEFVVMHSCDNRRCVRPKHLKMGTQQENIQDTVNKDRQAKGIGLALSKLEMEDIIHMRSTFNPYDKTKQYKGWAKKLDVAYNTVREVVTGKLYWKYLPSCEELQLAPRKGVVHTWILNELPELRSI